MTDDNRNGLPPDERAVFDSMSREIPPPSNLEDRTVQALRAQHLIRDDRGSRAWGRAWLGAAGVALLMGGFVLGRVVDGTSRSGLTSDHYVLLLYEGDPRGVDPAEAEGQVVEYARWAGRLRDEHRLVLAERLAEDGRMIRTAGGVYLADEGVAPPAGEVLVGMFVVAARDYEHAITIARSSPHLRHGGTVGVRRISPT